MARLSLLLVNGKLALMVKRLVINNKISNKYSGLKFSSVRKFLYQYRCYFAFLLLRIFLAGLIYLLSIYKT